MRVYIWDSVRHEHTYAVGHNSREEAEEALAEWIKTRGRIEGYEAGELVVQTPQEIDFAASGFSSLEEWHEAQHMDRHPICKSWGH